MVSWDSTWMIFSTALLCPVLPCLIFYIIVTDVLLSGYTTFVFLVCALLFIAVCFINLSSIASLRIKELSSDIPVELLSENDLEPNDEDDGVVSVDKWNFANIPVMLRNFFAFSKFHFSYGIISILGGICLTAALVLAILKSSLEMDQTTQGDLWHCVFLLMIPGIALPTVVLIIANWKRLYPEDYFGYDIFQDSIRVPMNIIAGRTFAAFLTGGYKYILQLLLGLVLFVYGLYGFLSLLDLSKEDIRRWQRATQVGNIRFILISIMIFAVTAGIFLVFRVTKYSYKKAKHSLLVIMEQNWQRNISACELLLPTSIPSTVDGLKKALLKKRGSRSLQKEERQAFKYLTLPLWKPKRAFAEQRN